MRLLQLSTYDSNGGAAVAAIRLHAALRGAGVDSQFMAHVAVQPGVLGPRGLFSKLGRRVGLRLEHASLRHYPLAMKDFSPHVAPSRTASRVRKLAPDIAHLHWVSHGMLRIEDFVRLGVPLVCSMHDMWTFTGGCHYAGECTRYRGNCGACPALGSTRELDLSRAIWERKAKSWTSFHIQLIAPSRWLAACARDSALFHDADVAVIPNTLDIDVFHPRDQMEMRRRCRLPQGIKLVLFGAIESLSTGRKGAHLLLPALRQLCAGGRKDVELVVLGASGPPQGLDLPLPAHYAGHVASEEMLAAYYAAADVVVLPSVQDNLPNVALEALACGRACVAFDIGGFPDLIVHGKTGYLARPFEIGDLAAGIDFCLDACRTTELGANARKRAETLFAPGVIARSHLDVYCHVLERSGRFSLAAPDFPINKLR